MSVATSAPVTEAVIAALKDIVGAGRVGDGIKPSSPEKPPASFYPYCVVHVGTTLMQGSLVNPKEDGLHRVQVTSIGRNRESAETLRDQVRPVLLDTTLAIDGYAVVSTELVTSQPIARDDEVDPPLFYAVDVVNMHVTPAGGGS